MFYSFPHINHIDEVRQAIARHRAAGEQNEFFEAERGELSIFNYTVNFEDTFRSVATDDLLLNNERAILRECRGLIFHRESGLVIRRPFHKFFNVNERDETAIHRLDLSVPHVILEKLDGSMITPFRIGDKILWGTKMGATGVAEPVAVWVSRNKHYIDFVEEVMSAGLTPIFEWCSRLQKIVIDYPVDRLVLTALRHNITGEYVKYPVMVREAQKYGVDFVRALPGSISSMETFLEETRGLRGQEGWVIRFDNGHMLKVKAQEYVLMHKTKDNLNLEKNVILVVAGDKIDDMKPLLDDADRHQLDSFYHDFNVNLTKNAERLYRIARTGYDNTKGVKKRYAQDVVQVHQPRMEQGILFTIYDLIDRDGDTTVEKVAEILRDIVAKNTGTRTKVDFVRHLFGGINWYDYRKEVQLDD